MKKIAPEIERLMWLVAEQRDPKAIEDFEARFPDFKYELAKRISMLRGLQIAGKQAKQPNIPRFVPRNVAARPTPTRSMVVSFAFILGALAFGTYTVATMRSGDIKVTTPPPVVRTVTPPDNSQPLTSTFNPQPVKPYIPPPDMTVLSTDPLEQPVSVKVDSAPLKVAIAMLCKQVDATFELAPNVPEVDVSMDYEGESALQALTDLGDRYGFTPFPQERGKVLIVPAKKPDKKKETTVAAADSSRSPLPGNSDPSPR
jgi:hypothetical protein